MNSRKKAQKAQKRVPLEITSQHGQAHWWGAAFQFCSSIGWLPAAPADGSSGNHSEILTYAQTTQQGCLSIVSIFALFVPFCGYSNPPSSHDYYLTP
jgi:hypothetical protein